MANFNSTIADRIVDAANSGKEAKFIFDGEEYEFSPEGLFNFFMATLQTGVEFQVQDISTEDLNASGVIIFDNLPTSDPAVAGQLWSDTGVLTVSAG